MSSVAHSGAISVAESGAVAHRSPQPPGTPIVMGVVNVTPDSFSDGGRFLDADAAIAHGLSLIAAGADIVDIGGESTRPGATRPLQHEELARVVPVVQALANSGASVSVDTMRASVAAAAIDAGASIVNDVSGGLADPEMGPLIARTGVRFVAMHWRGHSADMQTRAVYDDVVTQVCAELSERVQALLADGVAAEQLIIDPGLGFAKTAAHNWALLAQIERVSALGFPVLVGTSRKAFLGALDAGADGVPAAPELRDAATAATSFYCATKPVWGVRVHDVTATRSALRVAAAIAGAR